jgi:hypothetical protein
MLGVAINEALHRTGDDPVPQPERAVVRTAR